MFNMKQIMNDKKGTSEMWWIIVAAVIAVVVVVLIIMWFTGSGGKIFGTVNTQIDTLGDVDKDKVSDIMDKCKDTPANMDVDADGCSNVQLQEKQRLAATTGNN